MKPSSRTLSRRQNSASATPTTTAKATSTYDAPPMITAFVPPASCSEHAVVTSFKDEAKNTYEYWVKWAPAPNMKANKNLAKEAFLGCYPPNFLSVWDATKDQYFSPATCPVGYLANELPKSGEFNRRQCCLNGFKPDSKNMGHCTVVVGTMTVSAPAVNVRYKDSDVKSLVTAVPSASSKTLDVVTTAATTGAISATLGGAAAQSTTKSTGSRPLASAQSVPGTAGEAASAKAEMQQTGLPIGAKVAIGVLVPLFVFAIIALVFFLLMRRKKKAKNGLEFSDADSPTGTKSIQARQIMEISGPYKPEPESNINSTATLPMYCEKEVMPPALGPALNDVKVYGEERHHSAQSLDRHLLANNARAWDAPNQQNSDAPEYWAQAPQYGAGPAPNRMDRSAPPEEDWKQQDEWETQSFPPPKIVHMKSVRHLTIRKNGAKPAKLKIVTADGPPVMPTPGLSTAGGNTSPTSIYPVSARATSPVDGKPRITQYLEYYMVPNPKDNPLPPMPTNMGIQRTKTGGYY